MGRLPGTKGCQASVTNRLLLRDTAGPLRPDDVTPQVPALRARTPALARPEAGGQAGWLWECAQGTRPGLWAQVLCLVTLGLSGLACSPRLSPRNT